MSTFRVYLAGFDVFRPDALAYGRHLQALCARLDLIGLYPLDNAAPTGLNAHDTAAWIYRNNVALIQQADGVMANLNPFRGHEPDSGTAFEVGYAAAAGKPVWGYIDDAGDIASRVAVGVDPADRSRKIDAQGLTVEDFDLPVNLMLACSVTLVQGDAQACLARIAASRAVGD